VAEFGSQAKMGRPAQPEEIRPGLRLPRITAMLQLHQR